LAEHRRREQCIHIVQRFVRNRKKYDHRHPVALRIDITNVLPYGNILLLGNVSEGTEMQQVIRSTEIHVPPSNVWRWMATQEGLRQWISSDIEIELRVGGTYRFLGPDHKTWISGIVLELVPEKSLILSWLEEDSGWNNPARLVITLAPTATGTLVNVIHDGFEGIGLPDWAETVLD